MAPPKKKKSGRSGHQRPPTGFAQVRQNLPRITVVTPSFNQGKYIQRTIESVLGQGYPNLDYVVMDGGSTDETIDILKRYEGKLRWISEKDKGQSDAINKGFRMATGDIVAWLNSDDMYLPGSLEIIGEYFAAHPETMMVYGEGYILDEYDNIKSRFPFTEPKFDLWKLIYFGDYILQQTTFYRKQIFESISVLDEGMRYVMDWDLFIRIGKRFRIDYLPEYLGSIREHGEAKTTVGGTERFREIRELIRKHGVKRYSLSYFNYAWDTYGKLWFPTVTGGPNGIDHRGASVILKRIMMLLFNSLSKRLQQGLYEDGWIGKRAMIVLPNLNPDERKKRIVIDGETVIPNVPLSVRLCINRKVSRVFLVSEVGQFRLELDFSEAQIEHDCYHIEVECNKAFSPADIGVNSDTRLLAFVLKDAFVQA